jgi:hypothetical protein
MRLSTPWKTRRGGPGDTAKTKRCPPPRYTERAESHGRIPVLQGRGGSQVSASRPNSGSITSTTGTAATASTGPVTRRRP